MSDLWPTESTPSSNHPKKLSQVVKLATPGTMPDLVQIRPFRANGWDLTIEFIYTHFWELTYRSDCSMDFCANNAELHKHVPFCGLVGITVHLVGQNPNFRAE